jgi:two-component system, chemotaxis family, CheB/CheR fusion protein
VQQLLYGMELQLHLLTQDCAVPDPAAVDQHVARLAELVQETLRATRTLAVELSPPVLENSGLAEAAYWLAGHLQGIHGLTVEITTRGDCQVADKNRRVLLFQVLRELLFNVVKHARTDHAHLSLEGDGVTLQATVGDAGQGFTLSTAPPPQATGLGLMGMQERLRLFGGHITIQSAPGQGTQVTVSLPLTSEVPLV